VGEPVNQQVEDVVGDRVMNQAEIPAIPQERPNRGQDGLQVGSIEYLALFSKLKQEAEMGD
jgi:hypothetical protein